MKTGLYCFIDENLSDDGSFSDALLIPLSDFEQNRNIYECDAILWGADSDDILTSGKSCGMFFRLPQSVRALWLDECKEKNDPSQAFIDCGKLSSRYSQLAGEVSELFNGDTFQPKIFVSLTRGDLCVTLPSVFVNDGDRDILSELRNRILEYINFRIAEVTAARHTSDGDVASNIEEIKSRLEKMHVFDRNLFSGTYRSALRRLINIECQSADRRYECALLAALLLRTWVDETSLRWVYKSSGDLHYEQPDMMESMDLSTMRLFHSIRRFIGQVSDSSPDAETLWSIVFTTRALLSSIMGRNEADGEKKGFNKIEFTNFYGFYPFFDNNCEEVTSYYATYHSPDYCYGFLSLPLRYRFDLCGMIPAFLHEFFHYIPPIERRGRNECALKLAVVEALNPVYIKLCSELSERNTWIFKEMSKMMTEQILEARYRITELSFSPDNGIGREDIYLIETSMKFEDTMRLIFPMLDFSRIYDTAVSRLGEQPPEISRIFDGRKSECLNFFEKKAFPALAKFLTSMKEIRSDILMCRSLDIGLGDYIALLAEEPNFARLSADSVADSTILRFGFVCRYLYELGGSEPDIGHVTIPRTKASVEACFERCTSIISELPLCNESTRRNLIAYLLEYRRITVDTDTDGDDALIIFEDALCGGEGGNTWILGDWLRSGFLKNVENQLAMISGYPMLRLLREIYTGRMEQKSSEERIMFEYKTRLVFRDLLEVLPDIDIDKTKISLKV